MTTDQPPTGERPAPDLPDPAPTPDVAPAAPVATTPRKRSLAVPVTVVATLAIVTALLFGASRISPKEAAPGATGPTPTAGAQAPSADGQSPAADGAPIPELEAMIRRDPADPMALGSVDAPVVMVEFSDYQCPYCTRFSRDSEPVLVKEYVTTGILRIEWRDFPYLGEESFLLAQAGRAAAKQDKFWELNGTLMANHQTPNSGAVTSDFLAGLAAKAGLDVDRFRADLTAEDVLQGVQRDLREGQQIGVNGTPSFIINGRPLVGAQPLDVFRKAIDDAAKAAGVTR